MRDGGRAGAGRKRESRRTADWAARRAPFMQKLTNAPSMLPATPVLHCVFASTHGFSELHELGPSVQLKRRRGENAETSSEN